MSDEYKDFDHTEPVEQTMTDDIGKLALALSKAQGEITGALKDSTNPFFKSNYADLGNVLAACREPLSRNELAIIQTTEDSGAGVVIVTTMIHSSGQWIRGRLRMTPTKNDPQGIGSAITYSRRYSYAAIVGVAQVDDDGNQASVTPKEPVIDKKKLDALVNIAVEIVDDPDNDVDTGAPKAREIYENLNNDERSYFNGKLADKKYENPKTGRQVQYWKAFKQYLVAAA